YEHWLDVLLSIRHEWLFFFFQAEDGIRDYKVTGVQTCALPISPPRRRSSVTRARRSQAMISRPRSPGAACARRRSRAAASTETRSEERRVGKERRSASAPSD